jgi:hypothetical protein
MTTSRSTEPARTRSATAEPARARSTARSLADDLRGRSDDELAALLRQRPDLTNPVPADVGTLAVRSSTSASVARALDLLDRFSLDVVDALCVLPDPTTAADVAALVGADATSTELVLERLRLLALWWGGLGEMHLLRAVRDVIGPYPAGLGPAAPHVHAKDVITALDEAPEQAQDVIARLADEGPVGDVPDAMRAVTVASARTPIEWLLARGLLVPVDESSVALVREVGLHLRGGLVRADPETRAPALDGAPHDPARVSSTAAHAAFDVVRKVEELLEAWATDPPSLLRAGGLGVRELSVVGERLDVDLATATLLVEAAHAAGLLAESGDVDPVWLPTPQYDAWLELDTATRWTTLATAWLASPRVFGLGGSKDDRGNRLAPLSKELERGYAAELRATALEEIATTPPGTSASATDVVAVLTWRRPRRGAGVRADVVTWALDEAEALGVTGMRALSEHGRALLTGDAELAATTLADALPAPVDHVLLQADLTAVAPGPLQPELAREIALLADVESTGGATVYRFSESSLRRALDAGRDAADVHRFLERSSMTPVPQPLSYLVDDVARRHGLLRVGVASAYVRCDDESVIAELLADRRAAGLQLRRLAPTVVASPSPPDIVLDRMRELGYGPAAESPEGTVLVRRIDARRAPARRGGSPVLVEAGTPDEVFVAAAVRALRAGEQVGGSSRGPEPSSGAGAGGAARPPALKRATSADALAALRSAADSGATVWIGYSDNHGVTSERVVDALRVAGGFLTAYDHRSGSVRTFAIHRVNAVAPADPPDPS